jgi:hypothetical protein
MEVSSIIVAGGEGGWLKWGLAGGVRNVSPQRKHFIEVQLDVSLRWAWGPGAENHLVCTSNDWTEQVQFDLIRGANRFARHARYRSSKVKPVSWRLSPLTMRFRVGLLPPHMIHGGCHWQLRLVNLSSMSHWCSGIGSNHGRCNRVA